MGEDSGREDGEDPITDETETVTNSPTPDTFNPDDDVSPAVYPTSESQSETGAHAPDGLETILENGARADHSLLIIEDDAWDAKLLEALLKGAVASTLDVAHAGTLAEGLDRLGREWFQIILSDLNLPDSLASETLPRLREAVPDTPIIVLSGDADEAVRESALAAGALAFLVKGEVGNDAIIAEIIGRLNALPGLGET